MQINYQINCSNAYKTLLDFAAKKQEAIGFISISYSSCAFCKYRRDHFQKVTAACKECGFLSERKNPYFKIFPIWKEGYKPLNNECKVCFYTDDKDLFYFFKDGVDVKTLQRMQ